MRYSKYQKAVFHWVDNWARQAPGTQRRSLSVKACPGSGKTSVIVEAARFIPPNERSIFLAYNKAIAKELETRLPAHVKASTTHSVAFRVLTANGAKFAKIDGGKTSAILRETQTTFPERQLFPQIKKLVAGAKALGLVPAASVNYAPKGLMVDTSESWKELTDRFDIEFENAWQEETAIGLARQILKRSIEIADRLIDFDDMLFLPVVMGYGFPKYKWVVLDEGQDIAITQREIVRRLLSEDGHLICVADENQSVYAFRGADSDSVANIEKEFNCDTLPLSICYRCAKSIVREAKTIVPDIEYADSADEGVVSHGIPKGAKLAKFFTPDKTIICPYNAPMVALAFKLIRERVACRVLGKEIGKGIVTILQKLQADNAKDAASKLDEYYMAEMARLGDKENQQAILQDKVETLHVFLDEAAPNETIDAVITQIETLFADEAGRGMVTLMTGHRSKGLQFQKVVLLDSGRLYGTSRKGKPIPPREIKQRMNLLFVMLTRAQSEMTFIASEELKDL